jgi:hypothetical protein
MATQAEKAISKMLVSQFNKQIAPVTLSSKAKLSQINGIKESITNINISDWTPISSLQSTVDSALDGAFKSSAWLVAEDANSKIQAIQNRCDFLGKMGIGQAIDKIASGVAKDAADAANSAIDAAKSALGFDMPEFGIGSQLSDLINKGVAATEPVRKELEGTVSSILETGKGVAARASELASQVNSAVDSGIDLVAKGLSTLAGPLKELDKLINCVNEIGGSEFTSEADQMITSLNQVYADLGVNDDPLQKNFGEFNTDTFFASMPGITTDQKENMLKATNMNDQSKNNAMATVSAAKSKAIESESSQSSLSGGTTENIGVKKQDIQEKAKVEFESEAAPALPASPGSPPIPEKQSSTLEPVAETVNTIQATDTPPVDVQPVGTPYGALFPTRPIMVDESLMGEYLAFDSGQNQYPTMFDAVNTLIPKGSTTKTTSKQLQMALTVTSCVVSTKTEEDDIAPSGTEKWTVITTKFTIYLYVVHDIYDVGEDYKSGLTKTGTSVWNGPKEDLNDWKPASSFGLSIVCGRVVAEGISLKTEKWTGSQVESLL